MLSTKGSKNNFLTNWFGCCQNCGSTQRHLRARQPAAHIIRTIHLGLWRFYYLPNCKLFFLLNFLHQKNYLSTKQTLLKLAKIYLLQTSLIVFNAFSFIVPNSRNLWLANVVNHGIKYCKGRVDINRRGSRVREGDKITIIIL